MKVLENDLGILPDDPRLMEVLNKADLIESDEGDGPGIRVFCADGRGHREATLHDRSQNLNDRARKIELDLDSTDDRAVCQRLCARARTAPQRTKTAARRSLWNGGVQSK